MIAVVMADGGYGRPGAIQGLVKYIRAQIEHTTLDYDRESCRSGWPSWSAA